MLISNLFKHWRDFSGRASRLEFFVISILGVLAFILTFFLAVKIFEVFFGDYQKAFYNQIYSTEYTNAVLNSAFSELLSTGTVNQTIGAVDSQYRDYEKNTLQHAVLSSLSFILFLPFAIAWIAGAVRRLHDIGTFGWWVFIILVPVYLFFENWILIAPLLFLFFKDGQPFYNQYGPDPKNPNAPIPLEIPKSTGKLSAFENRVLALVEKLKEFLKPYFHKFINKVKNKES